MDIIEITPMSRAWIKDNTGPAVVLVAKGTQYLTMIAALQWTSQCGPGPERRRHAGYAHARIVGDLPAARPETILHVKELLALVDGLEHYARLDNETGESARSLLVEIRSMIETQGAAKRKRSTSQG